MKTFRSQSRSVLKQSLEQCLVMVNIVSLAAFCRLAGWRAGRWQAAHVTVVVTSPVQRTHPSPSQPARSARCVNRAFCTLTCEQRYIIIIYNANTTFYLFTTYLFMRTDDTQIRSVCG